MHNGNMAWIFVAALGLGLGAWRDWRKAALALAWFTAFLATNNRELYFPFAMHWALLLGLLGKPFWRMGLVVLAFFGVRIAQEASASVLAVEGLVSVVALGGPLVWWGRGEASAARSWLALGGGVALAYAGLFVN